MKHKTIPRISAIAITALLGFFLLQSCKKSSGGSTAPATGYYFTATINGKSFTANFVSPNDGGPGIASTTTSNGVTFVVGFGIQIANTNDSSIMVIVFPITTPLNTPTDLSPGINTGAAYSVEASPGSSTYNSYGTNPAYGGSGTFTVTEFDQTNKVVAGTFNGTFGSSANTTVTVTNGKFRCNLISSTSTFPPNVKF
jgi:hypothetical protein